MEDDLNDIDLIDKYLEGGLSELGQKQFNQRYLNDGEFKKEVEVYRKLYEGIEQAEQCALREKLDGYFEEFKQEELLDGEYTDSNVRPINWRRRMYWISGVAASACLFAAAYFYFRQTDQYSAGDNTAGNKPRHSHVIDTAGTGVATVNKPVTPAPASRDTGQAALKLPTKLGYSLTDESQLPASAIKKTSYPQALSYTFYQGLFTLYGDPLTRLWATDVKKTGGQYYLAMDDAAYIISPQTQQITPLIKLPKPIDAEGTKTTENIQFKLAPLQATVYAKTPFHVTLSRDLRYNKYYFIKDKNELVVQSDFKVGALIVVSVKRDGTVKWYLLNNTSVYLLDLLQEAPALLKELPATSEAARFLNGRKQFPKPVLSF